MNVQRYARFMGRSMVEDESGPWVRYEDHVAALAEAIGYYCDCVGEHDDGCKQDYHSWQMGVRDTAKPRVLTADEREEAQRIIGELAGYASMCWTPSPSSQVFDSTRASAAVDEAVSAILTLIHDGGASDGA